MGEAIGHLLPAGVGADWVDWLMLAHGLLLAALLRRPSGCLRRVSAVEEAGSDVAAPCCDLAELVDEVEQSKVERALRVDGADTARPERHRDHKHTTYELIRSLLQAHALRVRQPTQNQTHTTTDLVDAQLRSGR
jgi:hypothetical protein